MPSSSDASSYPALRRLSHLHRLAIVFLLNLAMLAGLVVVGMAAHSLSVIAEAVDYLADAVGVGVAVWAAWQIQRGGSQRADRLAAFLNAGWLIALNIAVIAGASVRLTRGTGHVHGTSVLIVSAVAAVVMIVGALLLADAVDAEDGKGAALSVRAILLDTIADASAAAGVAVVGAVIAIANGLYWLDPVVALAIALVISYHAIALLRAALWPQFQDTDSAPSRN